MGEILTPVLILSSLALVFAGILGYASIIFEVKTDDLIGKVAACLPGVNCGACGYLGCESLAIAIVKKEAEVNSCPVGGITTAKDIAILMNIQELKLVRKTAFVKCNGSTDNAVKDFEYYGMRDCNSLHKLSTTTNRACVHACLGLGTCVSACRFAAIKIIDAVAVVDLTLCTACGMCKDACPKNLIELVPERKNVRVSCNSIEAGKSVIATCKVGCTGCKICEKNCPEEAIVVDNFLAVVNYEKCTLCGICVEKCPRNIIFVVRATGAIL